MMTDLPAAVDELGRPIRATAMRVVTETTGADELGRPVRAKPIRYVDGLSDTDGFGRIIASIPGFITSSMTVQDEAGNWVASTPVRVVSGYSVTDETGRTIRVEPVKQVGSVSPPIPVNSALPVIDIVSGNLTLVSAGTWSGSPTLTYELRSDGAPNASLAFGSPVPATVKNVTVREIATNGAGVASILSAAILPGTSGTSIVNEPFNQAAGTALPSPWVIVGADATQRAKILIGRNQFDNNYATGKLGLTTDVAAAGSPSTLPVPYVETSSAAHIVEATILDTGDPTAINDYFMGAVAAMADERNHLRLEFVQWVGTQFASNQIWQISNVVAGTATAIDAGKRIVRPYTGAGDDLALSVRSDGTFQILHNGVAIRMIDNSTLSVDDAAQTYNLNAALVGNTKAGIYVPGGSPWPTMGRIAITSTARNLSVTSAVLTSYSFGVKMVVTGTYLGTAPTGIDLGLETAAGAELAAVANGVAFSTDAGAKTWTATRILTTSAAALSGASLRVQARKTNVTADTGAYAFTATTLSTVTPLKFGMNGSYLDAWNTEWPFIDIFNKVAFDGWVSQQTGAPIPYANRNADTLCPVSFPAGTTGVYCKILEGINVPLVAGGTYEFIYPAQAGMTVAPYNPYGEVGSVSHNTGTRTITFTLSPAFTGTATGLSVLFTGALPSGAWKPTCRRVGEPATPLYHPSYEADIEAIPAKIMRFLVPSGGNDGGYLQLPISSIEHLSDNRGCSLAFQVALCNATGCDFWFGPPWRTPDAVIEDALDYITANLNSGLKCFLEIGNEDWNPGFIAYHQSRAEGVAAGLWNTLGDATPTAVRNMVLESGSSTYVTGTTTFNVTITAGTRIYTAVYGAGQIVLDVNTTINPGDTISGTGSAKTTLVADNTAVQRAYVRIKSRKLRFNATYGQAAAVAAGKTGMVVPILGLQYAGNAQDTIDMLDWESLHTLKPRLAGAAYWGTDFGNPDNTVAGFTPTQKALYATDLPRWLDHVVRAGVQSVNDNINTWLTHLATVRAHAVANWGWTSADVKPAQYEWGREIFLNAYTDATARYAAMRGLRNDLRDALVTKYGLSRIAAEIGGEVCFFDFVMSNFIDGNSMFGAQHATGDQTAPMIVQLKQLLADIAADVTRFDLICPTRTGIGAANVTRTGKIDGTSSVSWAHTGGGSGTLTFQPGELIKAITFTDAIGTLSLSSPSGGVLGNSSQGVAQSYYVNAATGSDSNAGTSSGAAWLTLAPLRTLMAGLANGQHIQATLAGAFVNQHLVVTNTVLGNGQTATAIIDFAPGASLTWTAGTDQSAIEPAAATTGANLRVEVNGETGTRTTISGFNVGAGNALGTGAGATLIARWIRANDCVDGVSAHFSSSIETYDCLFENCTKSTFAHVNTAGIVRHTRDIFRGKTGAVIGVGAITDTRANAYFFTDCSFEPVANDQQTTFAAAQLTRCKVGTLSVRCFLNNATGVRPILTDCFVNLWIDGDRTATLTRCYGKLSVRMRPGGDITIEKGVFNGPATGQSSGLLFANFNAGGMGKLTVTDTILTGYTTAIGEGFSATYAGYYTASASSVTGMWGYGNTTNVHASLISAGAAVSVAGTSNPLLAGTADTLAQSNYAIGAASPCRGAGAGGSDIGFR